MSLPSYHSLPRPTLASSAILPLPCPTLSYPSLHSSLLPSYRILPRPTLESSGLLGCWLNKVVEPTLAYPSLPQPASSYSGLFSHPTLAYPFIQPSTSYTGVVIHPTPSYHSLLRPTLQWSAILAYSGSPAYRLLPRPTRTLQCRTLHVVDPTLSYPILPQPSSSYTGLFSQPTLAYPIRCT